MTVLYFVINTYAMYHGKGTIIISSEEEAYFDDTLVIDPEEEGMKFAFAIGVGVPIETID